MQLITHMPVITHYIKKLQSNEVYSFSWEELPEKCPAPVSTLRKELIRLAKRNEIRKLRKGFYIILPPKYQGFGKIPIQLYVDKLFKYLGKPYYIAFYSAALEFGATHQRIQKDYVITTSPALRSITNIRFFKTTKWPEKNIVQQTSDAGYYNSSSPCLTAVDLIHYQSKVGGINRVLTVLSELSEEMKQTDLMDLLTWYPHKSTLQRLGFLLEEIDADDLLIQPLIEYFHKLSHYPVLLCPGQKKQSQKSQNKWKVNVNSKLEGDL